MSETRGLEISRLAAFLLRERKFALRFWWLLMPLGVATALTYLRLTSGLGSAGIPLVFYLPAIIATSLVAGTEFGIISLIVSLVLVWLVFMPAVKPWHALTRDQTVTLALWAIVSGLLIWLCRYLRSALRQLSQNEARYRKLVEVTSDIVWVTDAAGHAHVANDAFARITGTTWPQFSGRQWLKCIHEEDRPALMPRVGPKDEFHQVEFRLWDAGSRNWRWFRSRAVAITTPQGEIIEWITAMRDVHEPKLARERSAMILGESRHRLKNLVTIIEALARSSRPRKTEPHADVDAFLERFLGRLRALGAAADLALAGDNQIMDLREVVRATLVPFAQDNQQIRMHGPSVVLSQETGGSIALAIHELATNAIKYGALSLPRGSVTLGWSATPAVDGECVTIIWTEQGGPSCKPPSKDGYGTRVIRAAVSRERDSHVTIEYLTDGLRCELNFVQDVPSSDNPSQGQP